ncbi:MAG: hydroxymethylbilane synthase [Candidatus Bathyarchaeota archaeon]|nr:hydroxymethylbilane synthase [Candidatus Bathyarchaeota archaeon]
MILTVGTRGSKLSLMQTEAVLRDIQLVHPELEFKVKIIKTLGDMEQRKPLFTIDSKGIFEKEIDQAILKGEVDLAVHSLKDIPILGPSETVIAATPKRGSRHDVLISKDKVPLNALPKGATVGTGSLRRLAQVKFLRPDLEVKPIRGNVDTRIRKVKKGEFDAAVVAEAGLERMGLEGEIAERFSLDQFPSAAGQGALAIVTRKDNNDVIALLQAVDDPQTRAEITAERSLVRVLEGGCRVPIGAVGQADGGRLSLLGCIFSLNSQKKISATAEGTISEAQELGKQVAQTLIKQGAKDFEKEWREKYGPW